MSRPHTGKFINCLHCSKEFYIPLNRFKTAKYCSRKCGALDVRVVTKTKCGICSKEFEHISSRANFAKYCSRKCYYKSNHHRGNTTFECRHCGKKFQGAKSTQRKYCSRICINKQKKSDWIPHYTTIRKKMLANGLLNECQKCGYSRNQEILGVHHKDRNRNNNSPENLICLCPNCHSIEHKKRIIH